MDAQHAPIFDGTVINTEEPVPDSFFIFVKADNFVAQHNYKVGAYSSSAISGCLDPSSAMKWMAGEADFLPGGGWPAVSPYAAFSDEGTSAMGIDLERFRQAHFRFLPSRLSAVYAFGDLHSCQRASFTYGWDMATVREFTLQPLPVTRVAKVNMEMITHARGMAAAGRPIVDQRFCEHYWRGGGNFEYQRPMPNGRVVNAATGTIWEYLVDGILNPVDM